MMYGPETWMMTPCIGRVLGGFHHRVDHRLMGRQPWRGGGVVWVYALRPLKGTEEVGADV